MKPAVDEMFPKGAGPYVDLDEAGGSTGLLMDLAANEKAVHADFFNDFEDLFDDDDIHNPLVVTEKYKHIFSPIALSTGLRLSGLALGYHQVLLIGSKTHISSGRELATIS
ncbi:hypothetical protein Celaphus_00009455 [Cervus elaphus hippelaphus]|uniref:COP9 signalosome complex subunit 9 n=1 Tax=Cervus elaphus hippelaphus TaxID=46360 RepID=A0A212C003_CEREH|nr:hypothetical protein Celaphus_00009455 [Cervus elaphus hippelaphus]